MKWRLSEKGSGRESGGKMAILKALGCSAKYVPINQNLRLPPLAQPLSRGEENGWASVDRPVLSKSGEMTLQVLVMVSFTGFFLAKPLERFCQFALL